MRQLLVNLDKWFKRLPDWAVLSLAALIPLLAYSQLPQAYFQQDEWLFFGQLIWIHRYPLAVFFHGIPMQRFLTMAVFSQLWQAFGANATGYYLVDLLLVIALVVTVFCLLRQWSLPRGYAWAVAAFVPVIVTGYQAVVWLGTFVGSLLSLIVALLSLMSTMKDLKNPRWYWRLLTPLLLAIALYFKEDAIWLLPMLAVTWYSYSRAVDQPVSLKTFFRTLTLPITTTLIILIGIYLRQIYSPTYAAVGAGQAAGSFLDNVGKASLQLPLQHLGQVIFSNWLVQRLATWTHLSISPLSYVLTGILAVIVIVSYWQSQGPQRLIIGWLSLWALVSFAAFGIYGTSPIFLEGRYYFPAQLPTLALLLYCAFIAGRRSWWRTAFQLVTIGLIGLNFHLTTSAVASLVASGQTQKRIIRTIQQATGPLPKQAIIFTESMEGYAGSPVPLMPFQSGFGQTLEVAYQGRNQDYTDQLKSEHLWDWLAQGYKESNGTGFGYYRNYTDLVAGLQANHLSPESVYAFHYEKGQVTDITSAIRGRLTAERQPLQLVSRSNWLAVSNDQAGLEQRFPVAQAIDNNLKTTWLTEQKSGTYFQVDLGQSVEKLAGLDLALADANSFARRYDVALSADGQAWQTIVHDEVPHLADNRQTIRFQPQAARFVRLTLTNHEPSVFAWSVAEVTAYQAQ